MKLLVAGIGNVLLGDDGFGCAVATALRERTWPGDVQVVDFGIRGMDLALALTSGFDAAILVDTVARGGTPGTLYIIEPVTSDAPVLPDSHAMDPESVLRLARTLGTPPAFLRVVGCEPAAVAAPTDDLAIGLSPPVAAAVSQAVSLVAKLVGEARCTS
ncbi:MAG: hydrogenase maturation protease [Kofleriaceae bacterium]